MRGYSSGEKVVPHFECKFLCSNNNDIMTIYTQSTFFLKSRESKSVQQIDLKLGKNKKNLLFLLTRNALLLVAGCTTMLELCCQMKMAVKKHIFLIHNTLDIPFVFSLSYPAIIILSTERHTEMWASAWAHTHKMYVGFRRTIDERNCNDFFVMFVDDFFSGRVIWSELNLLEGC